MKTQTQYFDVYYFPTNEQGQELCATLTKNLINVGRVVELTEEVIQVKMLKLAVTGKRLKRGSDKKPLRKQLYPAPVTVRRFIANE